MDGGSGGLVVTGGRSHRYPTASCGCCDKVPQTWWLQTTRCIILQFWRSQIQNGSPRPKPRRPQSCVPTGRPRQLAGPTFHRLPGSLGSRWRCWTCAPAIASLPLSLLPPSYKDIVRMWGPWDNLGSSPSQGPSCSAPRPVRCSRSHFHRFWGFECGHLWGLWIRRPQCASPNRRNQVPSLLPSP